MALTRPRAHQLSGTSAKAAVRVVSESNVTLSGGAPATVDGVSLTLDDRILVTGQSTASQNGLYRCTVVGSGSNGTWVRSRDGSHDGTISAGMTTIVTEGSTYADTLWKLTTDGTITIGTTALAFSQHSGGSGTPGGSDTQVQFNDSGSFSGDAGLTYNKTTDALTVAGTVTGGSLRADNFTTENAFAVVGSDNNLIQDTTLSVDPSSNYLGINQTSPDVTLHMTGEGAQTAQIRMEQYNDSADAPDVRTRRYRGTIASPSAVQAGDYLYRSNHEYWNGSALIVGGTFAFDNTNDANRTQFAVSVTTDGTSADGNTPSKVQFKIDGNDSGAITFNNAYKFPTADGSANNILATDGSGALTFTGDPTFTTVTTTGDVTVSGDILNGQSDGVGNIGNSSVGFNTVHAIATSAQYADLAEKYTTDHDYEAGTVVVFGGNSEITQSTISHDRKVAGVISTNPAVKMNDGLDGQYLALQGRVPCKVIGPIEKGDLVVTSHVPGLGVKLDDTQYQPGCVIGKALESIEDQQEQVIEVVVGRL